MRNAILCIAVLLGLCGCGADDRPPPTERVFLIGIDGATWTLMDPLLAEGKLPNIQSLIEEGVHAPLESMIPTKSPALWTTVATGKVFEKHGIDDFTSVTGEGGIETPRVMHMTSNMRKTKALWNIVGERDRGVAFVGWWVTWPAERVNGYMVSSHIPLGQSGAKDAPTKGTLVEDVEGQTWPPELFDELRPLIRPAESVTFEEARRFMDLTPDELDRDIVQGFRWAYGADETYRAVASHLLDIAPDLALYGIYFNGIDVVGHRYWKYLEPRAYPPFPVDEIPRFASVIPRYYEYTDELIGEILSRRRPGDTFLIVSDHGFHARGHRDGPDGVFIAAGANIAPQPKPLDAEAELVDFAPTVLALLNLPQADDMDGRVLEEIFTPAWRSGYSREHIETYDTEEWREQQPIGSNVDEEFMKRLRALGYVE